MRLVAAVFIIICGGILIVADLGLVPSVFSFIKDIPGGDKLGHFFLMGVLALLVNLALKSRKIRIGRWDFLLGSILVGVFITVEEISQIFISYRTFSLTDLFANYLGIYFLGGLALETGKVGFFRRHKIFLILVVAAIFVLVIPAFVIVNNKKEIYFEMEKVQPTEVAIVFGAGVKQNGTPSDALNDRLTVAAELYERGLVKKILVSGDNRFDHYNEPEVMREYLINSFGVSDEDIAMDFAGRRTYDTCARAVEIWGIDEAILVSQGYHLPRAIFTCEAMGIDSAGFSATLQPYVLEEYFKFREIAAIYKAIVDVYFWSPKYIGGEKEEI